MARDIIKLSILDRHSRPEALSCTLWSISFSIVIPLYGIFIDICTMRKIEFCLAGKEYACNAGDPTLIAGSRRSPGEGIGYPFQYSWASLVAQMVSISPQCRRPGFDPWIGKIPWRRPWQPTPVFLPGESSWTEKSGGLQSMGSQRVKQDWVTKHTPQQTVQYLVLPEKEGDFPVTAQIWRSWEIYTRIVTEGSAP